MSPPVGGAKLSDRVVTELHHRIVRGELKPGERLPTEAELGSLLHVSRSVVRDAMRTLTARGLVSVRQGRGMIVAQPSDTAYGEALVVLLMRSDLTMGDIMDARAAIETQLGALAATRGTSDDWDAMESRLTAFAAAVKAGNWERAHVEHLNFHLGLLRAIHLLALEFLLKPMHQIILRSSLPPSIEERELWDVDVHYPLLYALRRGDESATVVALQRHFGFLADERYSAFRAMPFREAPTIDDLLVDMQEWSNQPI